MYIIIEERINIHLYYLYSYNIYIYTHWHIYIGIYYIYMTNCVYVITSTIIKSSRILYTTVMYITHTAVDFILEHLPDMAKNLQFLLSKLCYS